MNEPFEQKSDHDTGDPSTLSDAKNATDSAATLSTSHDTERIFKAIIDVSSDAVAISDPRGLLVYANPALVHLIGDNAIGTLTCGGPSSVGSVTGIPSDVANGKNNQSWRPFYHHISFPIDTPQGTYYGSIIHDAAGILYAEESYRALIEYSLQGFCIYLLKAQRLVTVNQIFADIMGYSVSELLAFDLFQLLARLVHPDDKEQVAAYVKMQIEWKEKPTRFEFRCIRKNSEIKWVEAHINNINYGGECAIHAGLVDISDRKKAEEYKRYRELLDNMTEGVLILDSALRVLELNDVIVESMGKTREKLLHHPLYELIPAEPGSNLDRFYTAARERIEGTFEVEMSIHTGDRILLEINARPIIYQNRNCYLCVIRNITETRRLQDQLILSERLAATGQLAASIAHEINSPLQAITILLENLRQKEIEDTEYQEDLTLLTTAFEGISETVRHLLDLNRPGMQYKQSMNVNTVIEQTVALVRGSLKRHTIGIRLRLSRSIPFISASPQQLSQVLLNLINNAAEAMTTSASPASTKKKRGNNRHEISIVTSRKKDVVKIRVSDNGPGIPPHELPYVFDPFVTFRKTMGIGIGLSVCFRIMQDHNGTITAHNAARGGAVFVLTFPV